MNELEALKNFFEQRGVAGDRAEIMAKQLLKRAEQVAKERDVEFFEALEYLLEVMATGQKGQVSDAALGTKGLENAKKDQKNG